MNRSDFQQLSSVRLRDAQSLLEHGNWSGAYYICGYAVECALKACIARQTKEYDFPDKNAQKLYTHNLSELVNRAGLAQHLKETDTNSELVVNWSIVKDWKEDSRYELRDDAEAEKVAREFHMAVADQESGILKWIQEYW